MDIKATVALPIYNSHKIAFLALESLCNQITEYHWELIISEEDDTIHKPFGETNVRKYQKKLAKAGCIKITYLKENTKLRLLQKWIKIGSNISKSSTTFILQAADCYSPANRIQNSINAIKQGYDWYDNSIGLFYSFNSKKIYIYSGANQAHTNLSMAFNTKYIPLIPDSPSREKGIDGYLFAAVKAAIHTLNKHKKHNFRNSIKILKDHTLYADSLDTHGLNNISINRENAFNQNPYPFLKSNLTLLNTAIPTHIILKLQQLSLES